MGTLVFKSQLREEMGTLVFKSQLTEVIGTLVFKSQLTAGGCTLFIFFFFSAKCTSPSLPPTRALHTANLSSTFWSDKPGTLDQPNGQCLHRFPQHLPRLLCTCEGMTRYPLAGSM